MLIDISLLKGMSVQRQYPIEVPRVDYEKLADKRQVENSEMIRKRVQAAGERQLQRFEGTKKYPEN